MFRFLGCTSLRVKTLVGTLGLVLSAHAQDVISAKAGLVSYSEGDVLISDKQINPKQGDFAQMKAGEILSTGLGRAEVLLTPGSTLRVAENSSFRLATTSVDDVRLELLTGSALVEIAEMEKGTGIELKLGDSKVTFEKRGLVRVDADPAQVRVYDGEADVFSADSSLKLKAGKRTMLGSVVVERFDKSKGDSFHRWVGRRSGILARANVASMQMVSGNNSLAGSWFFNPYFGSFTYMPFNGYQNYWGNAYYSPRVIYQAPVFASGTDGWGGGSAPSRDASAGRSASVYSGGGGGMSAPPAASAPAAPSGGGRTGGAGASRGSAGSR